MNYMSELNKAIEEWSKNPIEDELLFHRFRMNIHESMSREDAFRAIDETVKMLLSQSDESNSIEILETIIALAHTSDTTEIPQGLMEMKEQVIHKINRISKIGNMANYARRKLKELFAYYRLGCPFD